MMRAIEKAKEVGARIQPVDRDIRITLSRTWRLMGLWTKIKLIAQLVASVGEVDTIREQDIESNFRDIYSQHPNNEFIGSQ